MVRLILLLLCALPAVAQAESERALGRNVVSSNLFDFGLGSPNAAYEFAFMDWATLQATTGMTLSTSKGLWRRISGADVGLGVRLFPLSRRAPAGWFFSIDVAVICLSASAVLEKNITDPAHPGDSFGIAATASVGSGYRWVLWRHWLIGLSGGLKYYNIDVLNFPLVSDVFGRQGVRFLVNIETGLVW